MMLQGRRILVTGGAAGIGREVVRHCADAGATVAVLDREACDAPISVVADVRDSGAVDRAVAEAAARMDGVDGLVCSAGVDLVTPLPGMEDADWERVLDVNLTGAMRSCRAVLRHWRGEGGAIVLVSSGAGLRPMPDRSAYCASKAGLNMLAKVLAIELAPRGIRANAICPGAVETDLFRSTLPETGVERAREAVRARYALNRIAEPAEIAACIQFLLSDASSFVTGVAMAVDGGRTFH